MTTPVACCGFECGVTGPHFGTPSNGSYSTANPRSGSRGLRFETTLASWGVVSAWYLGGQSVFTLRFYVQFGTLPTLTSRIKTVAAGDGLYFNAVAGTLCAGSSTVSLAAGVAVTTGVRYRVDLRINTTNNPHLTDVQIDGVAGSQHSNAAAGGNQGSIDFGSGGVAVTTLIDIDDYEASHTSGDYPIGAGHVHHFIPTSDGAHNVAGANDFERTLTGTDIDNTTTTAFQLVDDIPLESGASVDWINLIAPLNATDYVEVVFGPAPGIPAPSAAPRAVDFIVAYHALGTQANNLRVAYRDDNGGTQDDVRNATVGVTTVAYARKQYAAIPGGGAWTLAAFNASRARCFTSDANPDPYVDCYMIEAEFADAAVLAFPFESHYPRYIGQLLARDY